MCTLCADGLFEKEAVYHISCYRDFTRIVNANKPGTTEEKNEEKLDNSVDAVQDIIRWLIYLKTGCAKAIWLMIT